MRRVYVGKTKDVFAMDDGRILLQFKDAVTGADGIIDAGANQVIGEVAGKGSSSFRLTLYFFELLKKAGVATHFVGEGSVPNSMIVMPARSYGLEVICRERAWGSFVRRYGRYAGGCSAAVAGGVHHQGRRSRRPADQLRSRGRGSGSPAGRRWST